MKYVVCYTIPAEPMQDRHTGAQSIFDNIVEESRSEDYQPVYNNLDKIGKRILTSTYVVEFDGDAKELLGRIIADVPEDVRGRIMFFISEISTNQTAFPRGLL